MIYIYIYIFFILGATLSKIDNFSLSTSILLLGSRF